MAECGCSNNGWTLCISAILLSLGMLVGGKRVSTYGRITFEEGTQQYTLKELETCRNTSLQNCTTIYITYGYIVILYRDTHQCDSMFHEFNMVLAASADEELPEYHFPCTDLALPTGYDSTRVLSAKAFNLMPTAFIQRRNETIKESIVKSSMAHQTIFSIGICMQMNVSTIEGLQVKKSYNLQFYTSPNCENIDESFELDETFFVDNVVSEFYQSNETVWNILPYNESHPILTPWPVPLDIIQSTPYLRGVFKDSVKHRFKHVQSVMGMFDKSPMKFASSAENGTIYNPWNFYFTMMATFMFCNALICTVIWSYKKRKNSKRRKTGKSSSSSESVSKSKDNTESEKKSFSPKDTNSSSKTEDALTQLKEADNKPTSADVSPQQKPTSPIISPTVSVKHVLPSNPLKTHTN